MRSILTISATIAFLCILAILTAGIIVRSRHRLQTRAPGELLPDFSFCDVEYRPFSSAEIGSGPLLLIYFDPDCEHCEYEIGNLLKSRLPLTRYKVILITEAGHTSAEGFVQRHKLGDYPSFIVLLDTACQFNALFGSHLTPANLIYDRELKLVRVLEGEYKAETLIKYLDGGD